MNNEQKILQRLRKICRTLPEATETTTFGHPTFQVRKKTFAVLEEYKGVLSIAMKVGHQLQDTLLEDERFYRTHTSADTDGYP